MAVKEKLKQYLSSLKVIPNMTRIASNRPFPSSLQPLFQGQSTCEVFLINISFHSY